MSNENTQVLENNIWLYHCEVFLLRIENIKWNYREFFFFLKIMWNKIKMFEVIKILRHRTIKYIIRCFVHRTTNANTWNNRGTEHQTSCPTISTFLAEMNRFLVCHYLKSLQLEITLFWLETWKKGLFTSVYSYFLASLILSYLRKIVAYV